MLYARIPQERVGVLIGPSGGTKRRLEERTGTRVEVDSPTGEVTIDEADARDPVLALKARVEQIRARIIGTRGKTRRLIEELTGVDVSVMGHTVALVGPSFEMAIAREAVVMLLRGSEHATVYRFLERKRADIKAWQMGF